VLTFTKRSSKEYSSLQERRIRNVRDRSGSLRFILAKQLRSAS
jgi:hypothetical protein